MMSTADIRHSTFDIRRIGCIRYLNSKPLIYGLEQKIHFDVPAGLAAALRASQLDCALAPVAEYLEHPHYQILPSICIGSRGPVRSVYLAYRGALSGLKKAFLDPSSKTSSLLLQVVLKEFFGLEVEFAASTTRKPGGGDARLLIGDPALLQRKKFQDEGWFLLDLGEAWFDSTGLPFVYAVWLVREEVDAKPFLETLTQARDFGREHLEEIIRAEKRFPEKMVRSYLTEATRYEFGADEIKGILEFQRLLKKQGLISRELEIKPFGVR